MSQKATTARRLECDNRLNGVHRRFTPIKKTVVRAKQFLVRHGSLLKVPGSRLSEEILVISKMQGRTSLKRYVPCSTIALNECD